jgi:membrane protein implicated in regulation of membrane protease activity
MRRIDVIGIGFGVFAAGGIIYLVLRLVGLDSLNAGLWSQVIFLAGLIGWVVTYLTRVLSKNMTYNQQLEDYEEAVLKKRLEEMTPEELEALQQEVEEEKQKGKG